MPANKNALLRYRTIDRCLQNRYRKWTLDDLIDACSDALYEFTGKVDNVSRRTVQQDIQRMRSEELGYCAPIVVRKNKYYEYEDPDYSITNTPLTDQDLEMMSGAVATLKQLSGFSAFSGMEDIVGKLEDHIGAAKTEHTPVIFYEKNDGLQGLNHIPILYDAIVAKKPVWMMYKPYRDTSREFIFSPYCLKEFRNRWFVFGRLQEETYLLNLALDRIQSIAPAPDGAPFISDPSFDPRTYFDDIVGVTKYSGKAPIKIVFWATPVQAPYIETKPLHKSQKVVSRNEDGSITFQIEVVWNYEIERDLISFGERIKVLSPEPFVNHIRDRLTAAAGLYADNSST